MKRLITKLNSLNTALPGLLLGIILYGLLAEFVAVWFVPDWQKFTIGLWIGIAASIFMAVHMAVIIADVTDFMTEKQAKAKAVLHAILRYAVVALALGSQVCAGSAARVDQPQDIGLFAAVHAKKLGSFAAGRRR